MLTSHPTSHASLPDSDKRTLLRGPLAHAAHVVLCDAAEKRRESFWALHAMECLVEFKHQNNGRVPSSLDMIL